MHTHVMQHAHTYAVRHADRNTVHTVFFVWIIFCMSVFFDSCVNE
uniref:Uncharacterized protein n=1 Tax=Anguilla anguilla TaxID=7936 RepID=A0A0E9QKJ3_ANGAN